MPTVKKDVIKGEYKKTVIWVMDDRTATFIILQGAVLSQF